MIEQAWRMLPDSVRDLLPDRLPQAFAAAVENLSQLGASVNVAQSQAALVAAIGRGALKSRSESDWMALPIFFVDGRAPTGYLFARSARLNAIAREPAFSAYFARLSGQQLAIALMRLLDALEDAAAANRASRPETLAQTAERLRPVAYAILGFTPPTPKQTRRLPIDKRSDRKRRGDKPDTPPPEPTPPEPTPPVEPAAAASTLPRWLLPAAAAAAVLLILRR